MSSWLINWGFGGISWGRSFGGVPSLYVALRWGDGAGRDPVGFIVRWLPSGKKAESGIQIGRLLVISYGRRRGGGR